MGPVLDIGCGVGRHLVALQRRGVGATGVEISSRAAQIARARGGEVIEGSIFEVPERASWGTALLLDGNIGIGGDPERLLTRVAGLLCPGGGALVELDPPRSQTRRLRLRLEGPHEIERLDPLGVGGRRRDRPDRDRRRSYPGRHLVHRAALVRAAAPRADSLTLQGRLEGDRVPVLIAAATLLTIAVGLIAQAAGIDWHTRAQPLTLILRPRLSPWALLGVAVLLASLYAAWRLLRAGGRRDLVRPRRLRAHPAHPAGAQRDADWSAGLVRSLRRPRARRGTHRVPAGAAGAGSGRRTVPRPLRLAGGHPAGARRRQPAWAAAQHGRARDRHRPGPRRADDRRRGDGDAGTLRAGARAFRGDDRPGRHAALRLRAGLAPLRGHLGRRDVRDPRDGRGRLPGLEADAGGRARRRSAGDRLLLLLRSAGGRRLGRAGALAPRRPGDGAAGGAPLRRGRGRLLRGARADQRLRRPRRAARRPIAATARASPTSVPTSSTCLARRRPSW